MSFSYNIPDNTDEHPLLLFFTPKLRLCIPQFSIVTVYQGDDKPQLIVGVTDAIDQYSFKGTIYKPINLDDPLFSEKLDELNPPDLISTLEDHQLPELYMSLEEKDFVASDVVGFSFVIDIDYLTKYPSCQPKGMANTYLCRFEKCGNEICQLTLPSVSSPSGNLSTLFHPTLTNGTFVWIMPVSFLIFSSISVHTHAASFAVFGRTKGTTTRSGSISQSVKFAGICSRIV